MAEFNQGTQVLAADAARAGGFFKATVRKAEKRKPKDGGRPTWQYFVHYDGWNKRFDTWLLGDEVKEYESEEEEEESEESEESEEESSEEDDEDDDEDDDDDEDESDDDGEAPRRSGRASTRASSAASPAGLPPLRGKKRRTSQRGAKASGKRAKTSASGRGAKPSGKGKATSSKVSTPAALPPRPTRCG